MGQGIQLVVKLKELLEADTTLNLTPRNVKRVNTGKMKSAGGGLQASVHKTKSNTVVKKAYIPNANPEDDAYVKYVKLISEHQGNPFFPRIYSAKMYQEDPVEGAELGKVYLVVHMERLQELTGKKITDTAQELIRSLGINGLTDNSFDNTASRFSIAEETTNPQLRDAIFLMEPLFREFGSDLHVGNFMLRLTSTGPQLVFADPFIN